MNINLKQAQTLSPQLVQSMEILQMGSPELLKYIRELVQENPVVDLEEQTEVKIEFDALKCKLKWLESTDVQNRYYIADDRDECGDLIDNYSVKTREGETLCNYLTSQLSIRGMDPELRAAAVFVIESLSSTGYFKDSPEAAASAVGCTEATALEALRLVQSLEPAGIAARNLSECLCLQLSRCGGDDPLAYRIAGNYLEALAKSRYAFLARELKTSPKQVQAACERIRTLNPKPGSGFAGGDDTVYITPDVCVVNVSGHLEIHTNDSYFPSIALSGYYRTLMNGTDNSEVRSYLLNKMRQATWVIKSIEQRRSTLISCAESIVRLQEAFFNERDGHLVPMTLASVARQLGVHESTVSRAIRDKYLRCLRGVYPLSFFFSRGLGSRVSQPDANGNKISPDSAHALLSVLVAGEDIKHPLSDQKLCELMAERSVEISRRTVAKYRDELGIPCASGRKQYE
ncbi:MAG: RNA polymerase factor sigma-54 [Oscillospiraceae bacterium]